MTRATAKADGEGGQTPSHLGKKIAAFPVVGTGNPAQLQQFVHYDWEQAFRPTDECLGWPENGQSVRVP
ncbi:hypothetical protein E1B25_21910 [Antarcticimicrobium sediminis]|uniref:Uncharacterized protein n=1 Tax=Antarcticimicrobium sediminis TaxID=2546227 RepID=A0A4R5EF59_9RHOB|nr:hypothetical protein E1B25_21910 [Antarcticimicrobium sediminis]